MGDVPPPCDGGGWFCLFERPFSHTKDRLDLSTVVPEPCGSSEPWPPLAPDLEDRVYTGILPLGASIRLATAPSGAVVAWMRNATRERGAEIRGRCEGKPRVSLHIRTEGGRCGQTSRGGMSCLSPSDALGALRRVREAYGSCSVLLASDSSSAVKGLWELPGSEDFHWTWMEWDREQLASSHARNPTSRDLFVEVRGGLNWHVGFSMAADIALLSEGDIFVGGFDTMVGLTYYISMVGRSGMLPPYIVPNAGRGEIKNFQNWVLSSVFGCPKAEL